MKALFVFNHPAPYKVRVFNELNKLTDISVVFERKSAKDRPASFYEVNNYDFEVTFLKHGAFGIENTFTGELRKYIKKHHSEYDIIVMNGYHTIAEMRAIRYMIRHNIPYVLQINGGIIKKDLPIKKRIKTYFISNAYKFFSPCQKADEYLIHYGADKDKIYHYPYGNYYDADILSNPISDVKKTKLRKKWKLPEGKIFVNASQFIERKNNIQLIELFKGRQEHLLLIGSGSEKDKYLDVIKQEGINNVILMDFQNKKNLFEILQACDCFITLSREDIFGHTTLEAMANGLPVISSDRVVSSVDIIKNGKNGYLVNIEDNDNIVKAIDSADKLSAKHAINAAKKNTIEQTAATLNKLIRE